MTNIMDLTESEPVEEDVDGDLPDVQDDGED